MICKRLGMIALMIVVLGAASCGYHFSGEGLGPRPQYHRLAIPLFENITAEPGLAYAFTTALRREFNLRSKLQVVPVADAQMIFYGRIKKLSTSEAAHREAEDTIETRITVTLDIRCVDAAQKTILWQQQNMTYYEEYLQSEDPIVSFDNRKRALGLIAKEMAVRIHDRFLSGF